MANPSLKVIAAYLLGLLGNSETVDEPTLSSILASVGISVTKEEIDAFLKRIEGKDPWEEIRQIKLQNSGFEEVLLPTNLITLNVEVGMYGGWPRRWIGDIEFAIQMRRVEDFTVAENLIRKRTYSLRICGYSKGGEVVPFTSRNWSYYTPFSLGLRNGDSIHAQLEDRAD